MKKKTSPPPDSELLDAHFKDLATMPEPNEEPLEESEEEEDTEEESESPVAAAPPIQPGVPVKSRRPKKGKNTGVAATPRVDNWPVQANEVWDRIVNETLPAHGCTPENTYCVVYRFGMGQYSGQTDIKDQMYVARIEGNTIGGAGSQSPSEALTDYMETVVHPQAGGPARYQLVFHWLRGGSIKMGHMVLPHPTEIARRRAFASEYSTRQGMAGAVAPMMGPPTMPHVGYGQPNPYGYGPQQPAYYPPASPSVQTDPAIQEMRREMAAMMGAINEGRARDAERRGEPPPAPIAAPAVATPMEDPDARLVRLISATVNATLDARGLGATAKTGMGATPAAGVAAVAGQVKDAMGSLRDFMGMFKELEKFRKDIGAVPAAEEDEVVQAPNPIVEGPDTPAFGVRPIPMASFRGKQMMWPMPMTKVDEDGQRVEVDESFLERAARFGASNPEFALEFLEGASKILGQGTFGQLLRAFTAQGGHAADAAATITERGTVGSGFGGNGAGGVGAPPTSVPMP